MHPEDGRVISNFIISALNNDCITVYGDGKQTRSFCYCDDLIESFIKFMNSDENISGPINLGNPNEFSIIELAKNILKITNSTSKIVYKSLPEDDPKQRCPDISKAKKILDWEPKINLENGLIKTISYFKKLLETT